MIKALNSNNEFQDCYMIYRPGLQLFLKELSTIFEIIVFTASMPYYGGQILDILDPENKLFAGRLYRDQCIEAKIKDLTKLERELKDVIIIDNQE